MRILIAHNVQRARNGGMSRLMGEIHDRIVARGATVDYLCAEDVPKRLQNRWQRFTYPYLVARHVRQAKYDIVNVHEPSGALVALLKGRTKVVVTSHGLEQRGWEISLEDAKLGRNGPSRKTQILYPLTSLWQSRLALTRADHVFVVSNQDRDFLIHRFRVRPEAITRVYSAANPVFAEGAADRDYSRFRRLLFHGTWLARKGNQDAIAAFAQSDPSLEFATLGGGAAAERIRADFPEHLRHRVIVTQASNDAEAAQALRAADAYLLPSVFEGTPLTQMEAMYSGLPVITTDTGGMRDSLIDGETGLLVPVRSPAAIAQAIARLAANQKLRELLGRNAHKVATTQYTWENSAVPVWKAYRSLMGENA